MTKIFCDLCGKEMEWSPNTMYKYKLRRSMLEGWQYLDAHPECVNKLCNTVEERRKSDEQRNQ